MPSPSIGMRARPISAWLSSSGARSCVKTRIPFLQSSGAEWMPFYGLGGGSLAAREPSGATALFC